MTSSTPRSPSLPRIVPTLLALLGVAVVWSGAVSVFVLGPFGGMAGETAAGQQTVFWTTWICAPVAALLGTAGAVRRDMAGTRLWLAAMVMLAAAWLTVSLVA